MNEVLSPPMPITAPAPPCADAAIPARRFTFASRLGAIASFVLSWGWRWLVGAAMCFNFFILSWITSMIAVGWTNRVVQVAVLRCWWWRSDLRKTVSFADFCRSLGPESPSPRPRWFIQQDVRDRLSRPQHGRPPGLVTRCCRALYVPWYSLWLNFKTGFKASLCTYALTGLPCLLMLWSWEQGWINSFHGGYELAWVGPTMGFLGIFLFAAVMLYVPMAQAHLATTGQARAFFDFHFVWQLVRARITAYFLLAVVIGLWSMILHIGRDAVLTEVFRGNAAPTAAEGYTLFSHYLFQMSLVMFPAYVLLRVLGGLVYQSAVLKVLRRGVVTQGELHPTLRGWLDALQFHIVPRANKVGLSWYARLSARWTYRRVMFTLLYILWFAIVVRFYIGYFLVYDPYTGFLNHPLIQIPCFDFIPVHLRMGRDF